MRSSHKQDWASDVGKRLRQAYENSDLKSYKELAERINTLGWDVSADSIPKYFPSPKSKENPRSTIHVPGAYVLAALCEALEVSVDYIITGLDMYNQFWKQVFKAGAAASSDQRGEEK